MTVSSVGGAKWCSVVDVAEPMVSPIWTSPRPHTLRDLPGRHRRRAAVVDPVSKTSIAVTFRSSPRSTKRSRARIGSGEHPHVRDPLAGRSPLDLEHRPRRGTVGVALPCR